MTISTMRLSCPLTFLLLSVHLIRYEPGIHCCPILETTGTLPNLTHIENPILS